MKNLLVAVIADKKIDAAEVATIKAKIYADSKIDAEEISILFKMKDACEEVDETFVVMMVQAVKDWCCADGIIDEEEGTLILNLITADGIMDPVELAILDMLLENSSAVTCQALAQFMDLYKNCKEILVDGEVDAEEVESLKEDIYDDGQVDGKELFLLFMLKDLCSSSAESFRELLVQATVDYALVPEGIVDEEEGTLILALVNGDGEVDEIEKEILNRIVAEANEIQHEGLNALITELGL